MPTSPMMLVAPSARDRGVLVESGGVFAGRPHLLGPQITIGRSPDCLLRVDDEALSRTHARITLVNGEYILEDLGSLNGCYVGDCRVSRAVIRDGDRLRFGSTLSMRFQLVTDDEQRALVRIYEAGLRDALTGLANRKHFEEQLRAELSFARRHGTELSLVMADIDRFKSVNDEHGHLVGDEVLRHVGRVFAATVRTEDLVARFGGEEFVAIARGTTLAAAALLGERLRVALEQQPVQVGELVVRVTASFGVSSVKGETPSNVASLLGRADERLYRAKSQGRNRVVARSQ